MDTYSGNSSNYHFRYYISKQLVDQVRTDSMDSQNTNTQPSKEEMIECKKFVIQHVLEDLRKTKM